MRQALVTRVLNGPATLRTYGYGREALDVIADPDADEGAPVEVLLVGPLKRLRIPDRRLDLTLRAEPGRTPETITVLLPEGDGGPLFRLSLVNVRACLQGWPRVLELTGGSAVLGQISSSTRLHEVRIRGDAAVHALADVEKLTAVSGTLRLAGELRADRVEGSALRLACGDGEDCLLSVRSVEEGFSADVGANARLAFTGPPDGRRAAPATVVVSPRLTGSGEVAVDDATIQAPQFSGALKLVLAGGARVTGATGEIRSLSAQAACRLLADPRTGLEVAAIEAGTGAELSDISAFSLTQRSLAVAGRAAHISFWAGRSVRDGAKRARAMKERNDDRYLAAYWAAVLALVERTGAPGRVQMVARRAEMDFRRRALPLLSVDRAALELLRQIRYGQSAFAPLAAQLLTAAGGSLVLRSMGGYPDDSPRSTMIMTVRLFLAPLGVPSQLKVFQPVQIPGAGVWDIAVWLICLFTGLFCFSAAALAARRRITYT
ncbi:hypothetical protein [Actinomadura sp.]|uniref:hypothetical protein n=1 Tax=Actinomadura sp. TaxID=1989 RepID=UPI0037C9F801